MAELIISLMQRKDIPDTARVLGEAMRFNPLHVAANVLIYAKHGFQVRGREDIFGVTNFFMLRPAGD